MVLVVVGGAALWRLISTSSPLAGTQLGGLEADPLLLMAPALLFVALGSVLLRLFPAGLGLLARFFQRRRGLGGVLATWQVSREPVHYGRIAFLLTLAIGIGWFATSFRATVNRSQNDQARYQVGTDVRLTERDVVLDVDRTRPAEAYLAQPDVVAASPVTRFINVDVSNDRQRLLAGEVLGVDADSFGSTIYWRSDLGPVKAPRPPGAPLDLPTPGRALPFIPARIGLWARVDLPMFSFSTPGLYQPDLDRLLNRMTLAMRLRDEAGTFYHLTFAPVEVEWMRVGQDQPGLGMRSFNTSGWAYFEVNLADLPAQPQGALRLESLYWSNRARSNTENDVRLSLSDMRLIDAAGTATALDWLLEDGWDLVYDSGALIRGTTGITGAPDRPNLAARQILWDQAGLLSTLGIVFDYPEAAPIPAIASTSLLEADGLSAGDTLQLVSVGRVSPTVQILDTMDYYPTLYADRRPFLVVDQAALLYAINRRPSASVYPAEMWLRLAPGVSSQIFAEQVDVEGDAWAAVRSVTPGAHAAHDPDQSPGAGPDGAAVPGVHRGPGAERGRTADLRRADRPEPPGGIRRAARAGPLLAAARDESGPGTDARDPDRGPVGRGAGRVAQRPGGAHPGDRRDRGGDYAAVRGAGGGRRIAAIWLDHGGRAARGAGGEPAAGAAAVPGANAATGGGVADATRNDPAPHLAGTPPVECPADRRVSGDRLLRAQSAVRARRQRGGHPLRRG